MTIDPYGIVHRHKQNSVENVSLRHLITVCIKIFLTILTTIFMVRYAEPFLCEAPASPNLIF